MSLESITQPSMPPSRGETLPEREPAEKPVLIFLFGLTGAGKSQMAGIIRDMYEFHLHEGDDDFTDALKENICTGKVSTLEERDEFNRGIIDAVKGLQQTHQRLVVAQMFPLNRHRAWLRANFPEAIFVLVQTPIDLIDDRLEIRRGHVVDKEYAQRIRSSFEEPDFPCIIINNDKDVETYKERIQSFMETVLQEQQ